MKIIIFSGTTEGRALSQTLAEEGAEVIVSVASEYGALEQGTAPGITVAEGTRDEAQMRELIRGADLVVDATHPYAVLATANIRQAAEDEDIRLLRLLRERADAIMTAEDSSDAVMTAGAGSNAGGGIREGDRSECLIAEDAEDAAQRALKAAGPEGRVLLTTGSKELSVYASVIRPENLYARVLPLVQSIRLCEQADIPHRNIIAIQGPFSQELNQAVIRDLGIDVLVTKESGKTGGFAEKILACRACGIPAVVIARPQEEGISYDEVLTECRIMMKREKQ